MKNKEDITFKKIPESDKNQLMNLINIVIGGLEKAEYFIPYEQWELDSMFDESYAPLYGAYDDKKLVAMAQLYVQQDMLKEFKEVMNISKHRVCELGGNLVLPEYRGLGITTTLQTMLLDLAKDMKFDYILSMAHPDNIGSLKTLEKVGLQFLKREAVANGHLRDIYIKSLIKENTNDLF